MPVLWLSTIRNWRSPSGIDLVVSTAVDPGHRRRIAHQATFEACDVSPRPLDLDENAGVVVADVAGQRQFCSQAIDEGRKPTPCTTPLPDTEPTATRACRTAPAGRCRPPLVLPAVLPWHRLLEWPAQVTAASRCMRPKL